MHTNDSLNCLYTNPPKTGKFVAFYSDGGGASLFKFQAAFLRNADGDIYILEALPEQGYGAWIPIPDSYKFWFERE